MSYYCLKCIKNTESIIPIVSKTTNGKTMISKYDICSSKKSRLVKKQEASWILSNLGLNRPLSKIPLLGNILLWMQFYWM